MLGAWGRSRRKSTVKALEGGKGLKVVLKCSFAGFFKRLIVLYKGLTGFRSGFIEVVL